MKEAGLDCWRFEPCSVAADGGGELAAPVPIKSKIKKNKLKNVLIFIIYLSLLGFI